MKIKVTKEYITLGQLLKLADIIQSGGEAKYVVKELHILVNDVCENRRGRKLYAGDHVVVEDKYIQLV